MSVPTFDRFVEPLLHYLAEHPEGASAADAHEALAVRLRLSDEDRAEMLPSGVQAVYKNRIGWAHDRLKRAELSSAPRRGLWRLTAEGLAASQRELGDAELARIVVVERDPSAARRGDGRASPEERIDSAHAEVRERVARELLEAIGRAPPAFFEQLVLDLLHAMGYGARRSDLHHVGGSGDGGIDGIISLDRLGLEKVYVQAKRWTNTVGSPEVRDFIGALQLRAASKGVLITTSRFTGDARDAAARGPAGLVLVDGALLAALMIEHAIGVSHKALVVPRVDSDYFEDA